MRKLVVGTFTTLDGVMQAPGGPDEDRDGGFRHGSGNLIQTLLKHDLVDTLRIWQFPVVLGTGKRLFGQGTIPRRFRLVETQMNTTGAVLLVCERAGGLKYGEVEVGKETVIFDSGAANE